MNIVIPVLGAAFAAFCVWLTVRVINRRERWAKLTLAMVLGVPLLYLLSFGPACWITSRTRIPKDGRFVPRIYRPIMVGLSGSFDPVIRWYAGWAAADGWVLHHRDFPPSEEWEWSQPDIIF